MLNLSSHKVHLCRNWGWVAFVSFCLCWEAWGQTLILHMRNGDRISGRLLSETTNSVVLATAFAENVTIPKSLVEQREEIASPAPAASTMSTNQPPTSTTSTNKPPPPSPTPIRPPAPATGIAGELVLTNKPSMAQAAGGAKLPEAKPKPPEPSLFRKFLSQWRGEAQLGANFGFSTKDREAFTSHINLVHNYKFPASDRTLRNIFDYDVAYGTTDGTLSDNRMTGSWKAEYDLNKRLFVYNATSAGYDEIRGIDLQYNFGPGLGYKWVILTNFVFKTELGGDYEEQYFIHDQKTSIYSLRLGEDLWWQITKKIRWDEKIEFFPKVDDLTKYRVRLETNLSYLFKENLTLSLNVVDLYDTTVPTSISNNDLQIRSLLGIKF